jgi:hypothetical protein
MYLLVHWRRHTSLRRRRRKRTNWLKEEMSGTRGSKEGLNSSLDIG